MRRILGTLVLMGLAMISAAAQERPEPSAPPARTRQRPLRPAHTFSIVARDAATGEMGVAVQSHWFAVGAEVVWGEAGVGVVATQSFIDPSYGKLGLDLMRAGKSPEEALRGLLAADPDADARQVAMLDALGRAACFTGKNDIPAAGCAIGSRPAMKDGQSFSAAGMDETAAAMSIPIKIGGEFSAQANLMEKDTVWGAMARAFEGAKGDLTDRLIAALEAAQGEGGDIRGKQSAAILVVRGKSSGRPWLDKVVDLRVDDSNDPINELKRLVRYHRAYDHMENGDACSTKKDWECAVREYGEAEKLLPEQMEVVFWHAVTLVSSGHAEDSLPLFRKVFAREPKWAELIGRLPGAGLFPEDPQLLTRIKAQAGQH